MEQSMPNQYIHCLGYYCHASRINRFYHGIRL